MSDLNDQPDGGLPLYIYVQIIIGVAIQIAIFYYVDVYWAICATPMAFAAFAAVNLTNMDTASERRVKSILTWVTFGSIAVAVLARTYLR